MADNENTITTVFKADISDFGKSAQDLNRYVKQVNSEFAEATASMGKWSDNTDGLKAKLTQLNGVLQAEEIKLGQLKDKYAQLVAEGKENWFNIIKAAGTATLTCYLVPNIWYCLLELIGVGTTRPEWCNSGILGVLTCLLFSLLCVWTTHLLGKIHIKLKV